jgi:hypothetical protein
VEHSGGSQCCSNVGFIFCSFNSSFLILIWVSCGHASTGQYDSAIHASSYENFRALASLWDDEFEA